MSAAKKKPAAKGTRGRTTIREIRADVDAEFLKHARGVLTPGAKTELVEIFDATIGMFAKKMKMKNKKKDVWKDATFRAFILLAARRIGKQVAAGSIKKEALRKAAVKVMLQMHGMCPKPVPATHFKFEKKAKQGQVCQPFLEAQLTT
jgi:hypothetical protein